MSISPADMLLFAAVVRDGSFTQAAKHFGITKQTVSERVAHLEEQLGVRLLERTTRRMRVTDVGATYYERCAAIAAQIDEANGEVRQEQAEPVGLLRVSAPTLYGRRFLAPVVSDYLRRYPRARVDLALADRRVNLIEEGFDLAIRIGELDDSSLTARKLGEGHAYYVASASFLKEYGTPSAKELRSARCIGMRPFETWVAGGITSKIEPVLVVNDLEIACEAAVSGVGIARLPSLVCRTPVMDGRLQVLFGPDNTMLQGVFAVYPSRRYLAKRVKVFLDAVIALVDPMLPLPSPPH